MTSLCWYGRQRKKQIIQMTKQPRKRKHRPEQVQYRASSLDCIIANATEYFFPSLCLLWHSISLSSLFFSCVQHHVVLPPYTTLFCLPTPRCSLHYTTLFCLPTLLSTCRRLQYAMVQVSSRSCVDERNDGTRRGE